MRSPIASILVVAVFTVLSGTCVSGAPQSAIADPGNTILSGIVDTLGGLITVKKTLYDIITSALEGALKKGSKVLLDQPKEVERSTEIFPDIDERFGAIRFTKNK